MPYIPTGWALGRLRWNAPSIPEEIMTTYGLKLIGSPDPDAVAQELVDVWDAAWDTANLDNSWVFVGATVQIGAGVDPGPVGEAVGNISGGTNLSCPPPNCCILIKKTTAVGGRQNRGRNYIPAGYMAESDVDESGTLASGSVSTWQANATAFRVGVEAGTFFNFLGILHEQVPSAPTTVTGEIVQNKIATQRRRLHR